jgi:hypothetical protein
MEAFDAATGTADASRRARTRPVPRDGGVALGGISTMGVGQLGAVDCGFGSADAARRFEAAHRFAFGRSDEPVTRRHWRAVVEERSVADDDRVTVAPPHDDVEPPSRRTAQELRDAPGVGQVEFATHG